MKITNYNAAIARIAAFLLFGIPGALVFLYGTYSWLREGLLTDTAALKDAGACCLGLAVAAIFSFLAVTTDWSIELDEQDIRVRSPLGTRRYGWSELTGLGLISHKTKLDVGAGVDLTVHKKLQLALRFDAQGKTSAHDVMISAAEIDGFQQCLQRHGKTGLLGGPA